jgi:structural maintenance of chromosome 3 (chondroitin sulfate proteoglycan 6)
MLVSICTNDNPGCDPAPFYLFDELDQALDSTYRAAVASVIHRQANDKDSPTQFIVSTFRQELVAIADRCYGIAHQNKVSSIYHMPKRDAQTFISNLMSEEEAVGEVTVLTASKVSHTSRGSSRRKSPPVSSPVNEEEGEEESRKRKSAPVSSPVNEEEGEEESRKRKSSPGSSPEYNEEEGDVED